MNVEKEPFFLLPLFNLTSYDEFLEKYLNVILSDNKEEGGKGSLISFMTQIKNYTDTSEFNNLKKLYGSLFKNFKDLRKKLQESSLEKLAQNIEMESPDERGFGTIIYQNKNNKGIFGMYRYISLPEIKQLNLLK
jgi:hypothetical protein